MSRLGYGYGSEWHLLRYLAYHRQRLDEAILARTGGDGISWLDSPFNCAKPLLDDEWKGLDFLTDEVEAKRLWSKTWPTTGNVPNWDAVGRLSPSHEWLLVEAKAHVGELITHCGAKEHGGRFQIRRVMEATCKALGAMPSRDWLTPYYQYANRLAVLTFLLQQGIAARLVFIYFTGDTNPNADCPESEERWQEEIGKVHKHLGLTGHSDIEKRVHHVFSPTCQ